MIKFPSFKRSVKAAPSRVARNQAQRRVVRERPQLQIDRRYLIAVAAVFVCAWVIMMLPKDTWLPIERIRISGAFSQLDTERLQSELKPYLGTGFFTVDIQRIQQQVNRQPWIRDVSVRRVWPNQIMVSVVERKAYARWDEKRLISTRGVVFEADTTKFAELPLINGYVGNSVALLRQYVELKQRLTDHGIELNELREDNKGALSLLLDKQLRVSLGSHDNEQKIRYLLAVFPGHIRPRSERIAHIDFRYNNGFAIAWKEEARQQASDRERSNKNV